MTVSDHKIKTGGLNVYYRLAGDPKKRPLVFLHGWGARANGLGGNDRVVRELGGHFYVIAPEHPGLIRSDIPKKVWVFSDYARFLKKLVDKLGIDRFLLAGQSFGGGVAAKFTEFFPKRVEKLILVDAVVGKRTEDLASRFARWGNPRFIDMVNSKHTPFFAKKFLISAYLGRPLNFISGYGVSKYSIMGKINNKDSFDVKFDSIDRPTLMVWGDKDTSGRVSLELARKAHSKMKRSKLIVVRGGHTTLYQKPKYVVGEIIKNLPDL